MTGADISEDQIQERVQNEYSELNDQEIASLSNELLKESGSGPDKSVLIGPLLDLDELMKNEFKDGDLLYLAKLRWLKENNWNKFRRTAGDGDCFYRSFMFALLEAVSNSSDRSSMSQTIRSRVLAHWPLFERAGYTEMILEEFWQPLKDLLDKIEKNQDQTSRNEEIVKDMNDPEISNYTVVFLRLLTSSFLQANPDDYLPFLLSYDNDPRLLSDDGMPDVKRYCQFYIEPVNKEADHLVITILTRVFGLKLKVAYLDLSKSSDAGNDPSLAPVDFYSFESEYQDETNKLGFLPNITLLYRPGHYDILKETI